LCGGNQARASDIDAVKLSAISSQLSVKALGRKLTVLTES
jgi:hypothetical protein